MTLNKFYNKVIILGLIFNSFITYAQRTIYVNGTVSSYGNGSEQTPYKSFKTALSFAQNGDVIKILGKATEQYGENGNPTQDGSGEPGRFVIDKEITIDGDGNNTLEFTGLNLSLTKNVIFKNLRLSLIPLTNLTDAFAGISKSSSYIFVNGNKVTFNNVITKIENGNADTRPVIIAGVYKNISDAGKSEVVLENSPLNGEGRLKAIIAGNTNTQKSTSTKIMLDRNARVDEVFFGGVEHSVTAKVTVISESSYIKKYNATNSDDNLLELIGYTVSDMPTFTSIKDLSLKSSILFNISPFAISRNLILDNNSQIGFVKPDPDGFSYTSINLNQLESKGGRIVLPEDVKIIVNESVLGTLNLDVSCNGACSFFNNKVFMEANDSSNAVVNFSSPQTQFTLKKVLENGRIIWKLVDVNTSQIDPVNNLKYTFNQDTNTLVLTWEKPDNIDGLTGYQIYRDGDEVYNTTNIDALSYTEVMTISGDYEYEVIAVYGSEYSDAVAINVNIDSISTNPTPPTNSTNITKGRVGINTREPKATLDIREVALDTLPTGTPQGVSFPNLTTEQREAFNKAKIKEGTMIYNTTLKCLEFYNGTNWTCIQIKNN